MVNRRSILTFLPALALLLASCNMPRGTPNPSTPPVFPNGTQPSIFVTPTGGTPQATLSTPVSVGGTEGPDTSITPTPFPDTVPADALQAVILVSPEDVLNVRQGPGTGQPVIGSLPYNATGIQLTGQASRIGDELWVEIRHEGGLGWVYAGFLTEYITPAEFCADPQVTTLLANLDQAITAGDAELFSNLVSPRHGVNVHYLRGGTIANYNKAEARFAFTSDFMINWGGHPASGMDVEGTFGGEVLPKLQETFAAEYETFCSDVRTGGVTYMPAWPAEYTNINFYSVVKPSTPNVDLDWRTWLVGVEYVDGAPYLFALMHFFWEP